MQRPNFEIALPHGNETTAVSITTHFRIILEQKNGFRRLSTFRRYGTGRAQKTLATSKALVHSEALRILRNEVYEALQAIPAGKAHPVEGLEIVGLFKRDPDFFAATDDLVRQLPLQQWLKATKPDQVEGIFNRKHNTARNLGLEITNLSQRGTGSVKLTDNIRITVDSKLHYRRLMAFMIPEPRTRLEVCLTTAFNPNRTVLYERLRDVVGHAVHAATNGVILNSELVEAGVKIPPSPDHDQFVEAVEKIIALLPVDQWLSVLLEGSVANTALVDEFDPEKDDGRPCTLEPLRGEKFRRVDIWPDLRVILEDKGDFKRLSTYLYIAKGKASQKVLATTSAPSLESAQWVLGEAIKHYRSLGRQIPDSLVARLPVQQWIEAMVDAGNQDARALRVMSADSPDTILTVASTRGKSKVDSTARWVISPSVVLAFQERIDRPGLFLLSRQYAEDKKLSETRISSIPIPDIGDVKHLLLCAVTRDMENPGLDHRDLGTPLIDVNQMRSMGQSTRHLRAAIEELPLKQMLRFYDSAILPLRRNGHRQRLFPNYDLSMRWISHAGPQSRTATEDCWWVLIGQSRSGTGRLFPWKDSPDEALLEAQAWRDQAEVDLGISAPF